MHYKNARTYNRENRFGYTVNFGYSKHSQAKPYNRAKTKNSRY